MLVEQECAPHVCAAW